MSTEEWRPVPNYPFYSASNLGRVRSEARIIPVRRSTQRLIPQKILSPGLNFYGYPTVQMVTADGRTKTIYVHDAVTSAFLGPKPKGLEVRHLDDVKDNNTIWNLRYGTHSENMKDWWRNRTAVSA